MASNPNSIGGVTEFEYVNIKNGFTAAGIKHVRDDNLADDLEIPANLMIHRHVYEANQAGTVVTARTPLAVIDGITGSVRKVLVRATVTACVGAATVTVDIYKNGSTILTAIVTLNAAAALTLQAPTISGAGDVVDGDLLEAVVTATAGGGTLPVGLLVQVTVDELPTL